MDNDNKLTEEKESLKKEDSSVVITPFVPMSFSEFMRSARKMHGTIMLGSGMLLGESEDDMKMKMLFLAYMNGNIVLVMKPKFKDAGISIYLDFDNKRNMLMTEIVKAYPFLRYMVNDEVLDRIAFTIPFSMKNEITDYAEKRKYVI